MNWTIDPSTGKYYANIPSPTGIDSDPPLASYGVKQAHQLATALTSLSDPPISRIYSSPFYRCLETLQPTVERLGKGVEVRGDNGLGCVPPQIQGL